MFLLNQHVICNMFRDRRISCLIHALQVLYTLSILVGSHFMFPNPCRILHDSSNPCRICFYVCNPCRIHLIFFEYASLRRNAVDIFLVKNTP